MPEGNHSGTSTFRQEGIAAKDHVSYMKNRWATVAKDARTAREEMADIPVIDETGNVVNLRSDREDSEQQKAA